MKNIFFISTGIISALIVCFVLLYFVPIIVIKNVQIEGNDFLEDNEIIAQCNIEQGKTNMISYNYFSTKENIKSTNPYIKDISFAPISFDTVKIKIKENRPRGYVPYMNSYLCINEEGRVLDIQQAPKGALPIVSGLEFNDISKGEILKVKNPKVFSILVEISKLMEKYKMERDDLTVNISNPDDLHIYVNNLDVILGNTDDINQKISALTEILKEIGENEKGFLYLDDPNSEIRFKYLT